MNELKIELSGAGEQIAVHVVGIKEGNTTGQLKVWIKTWLVSKPNWFEKFFVITWADKVDKAMVKARNFIGAYKIKSVDAKELIEKKRIELESPYWKCNRIREGVKKGGINTPPKTPRPSIAQIGQIPDKPSPPPPLPEEPPDEHYEEGSSTPKPSEKLQPRVFVEKFTSFPINFAQSPIISLFFSPLQKEEEYPEINELPRLLKKHIDFGLRMKGLYEVVSPLEEDREAWTKYIKEEAKLKNSKLEEFEPTSLIFRGNFLNVESDYPLSDLVCVRAVKFKV